MRRFQGARNHTYLPSAVLRVGLAAAILSGSIVTAAMGAALRVRDGDDAHSVHRITLRHGHGKTRVSGRLNGYSDQSHFVLHGKKGQHLRLMTEGGGATVVSVTYPNKKDGDAAPGGVEVDLPSTGDYAITVTEHRMAEPWKGTFYLRVTLQ